MDKDNLIKQIEENKSDMLEVLKEWTAESLSPIFEYYTDEIIKLVREAN